MSPDELIAMADLMRRWAESVKAGKPILIQVRSQSMPQWKGTYGNPKWNFGECEYREKPKEPRRIRLVRETPLSPWVETPYKSSAICPAAEFIEVVECE
jgi:hypothetical protein